MAKNPVFDASKNIYALEAKSNPKDKIEVEIGDSKEPGIILPQAKIMRWDNESNVSIRLSDFTNYSVTEDATAVKFGDETKEVLFYQIEPSPDNPEGGNEIEIVLLKKPDTNIIQFTLSDKDVEYFYQPPLTQEEFDKGFRQPENVLGSYAVYAKSDKPNFVGGKEYKTGKVGHINRPKIIDSDGKQVWGDLRIENGLLTVTIPQEFLDTATYPIRQAAGLEFGYHTAGASFVNVFNDNWYGALFTSPAGAATATEIGTYTGAATSQNYKGTVVLHSTLAIISNGVGAAVGCTGGGYGWTVSALTSCTISASTGYVLGMVSSSTINLKYDAGDTNQGHSETDNSYASPTNPSSITHDSNKYSIYATYTAGGTTTSTSTSSSTSTSTSTSSTTTPGATTSTSTSTSTTTTSTSTSSSTSTSTSTSSTTTAPTTTSTSTSTSSSTTTSSTSSSTTSTNTTSTSTSTSSSTSTSTTTSSTSSTNTTTSSSSSSTSTSTSSSTSTNTSTSSTSSTTTTSSSTSSSTSTSTSTTTSSTSSSTSTSTSTSTSSSTSSSTSTSSTTTAITTTSSSTSSSTSTSTSTSSSTSTSTSTSSTTTGYPPHLYSRGDIFQMKGIK